MFLPQVRDIVSELAATRPSRHQGVSIFITIGTIFCAPGHTSIRSRILFPNTVNPFHAVHEKRILH